MTRKRRPKRFAQAFDHPVTGVVGGGQLGSLAGLFGLVVILMAGSKLGLVDQWGALVISGIVGGGIAGGVLGYFKLKQLIGIYIPIGPSLICQRIESTQINCTLKEQWLSLITLSETPIKGLQAARIEGGPETVVLVADSGEVIFRNRPGSGDASGPIQDFITSTERDLSIGGGGLESLPFLFPFTLGMVLFLGLSYSNLKKFQREN